MLTQARLKELLDYYPSSGNFHWKVQRGATAPGDLAGTLTTDGYVRVNLDSRAYKAHRLAWLYVHGVWPTPGIDHRNGIRHDNRIKNLREATPAQNSQNLSRTSLNTSGLVGVVRKRDKWQSQIAVGGAYHYLGCFATPERAHKAYLKAKAELHTFCPVPRVGRYDKTYDIE